MTGNYVTLQASIDKVNKHDSYKIELINARDRAELAAKNAKISEENAENSAHNSADSAEKSAQEKRAAEVAAKTSKELYNKVKQDLDEGKLKGEKGDVGPMGPTGPQGPQGETGLTGPKGDSGYTPQKGVDYWTAEEVDAVTADAVGKAEDAANAVVSGLQQQLAETKATLTSTQDELKKAQRAIQFQAELNQGQTWDFETDTQEAYQRQVPSGAKTGAVMEYGGKSRKGYQILTDNFPATSTNLSVTKKDRYSYVLETLSDVIYMQSGVTQKASGKAGKYTLHGTINGKGGLIVRFMDDNNNKIIETTIQATSSVSTIDVQKPFANLQLVFIGNSVSVPAGTRTEISKIMLESGDTAHAWEPYADSLLSAKVDEVRVVNAAGDSTDAYPIPSAVSNLPGYGWSAGSASNTIERTDTGWQYVQRVGGVDLGMLDWYDGSSATSARCMTSRTKPDNVKIPIDSSNVPNVICKTYDRVSPAETWLCTKEGITINTINGTTIVYDSQYSTAESPAAFKQHVQGVILYYELATPITTDITALMGDALAPFWVEAGGSITLHHPKADEGFAIDVPAKIQYITKLSEVSANG